MKKYFVLTFADKSRWAVSTDVIARNHAKHYAHEFDGDVDRSLREGTLPYFGDRDEPVLDWALNNMCWDDFLGITEVSKPVPIDKALEWGFADCTLANNLKF